MYQTKFHQANISGSSFLVTGGAGFIGSHIVEYLLQYGAARVRVLDNFATGSPANIKPWLSHPGFELMEGDIRDAGTCRLAVQGMDYISHQAALGSVPRSINDPLTINEVNISGFLNILQAAKEAQVKRMLYAASSSTYGDSSVLPKQEDNIGKPLSPYAVTKYVNELYADVFSRLYGFHTIGLRYFNVFGPRQNPAGPYAAVIPLFIQAALKNEAPYINGDGNTSRDFTFVENVVQANIKALLADNITQHEVMNIACGTSITLNELWQHISHATGTTAAPVYRPERKGDVKHSLADVSKAFAVIGYQPTVTIKIGLEKTVEWYSKHSSVGE
ncbi:SDR family oxidoreductase [Foetidibacter luteolus]|uniref:SDR family oxidoreductase n=1 Tax=Foetidibacter luteolus TaxID=2608880 RepID=UPI00129B4064|nr:SDR family oxidoreductase [Foetidibacter luteolus]